ncbi:MAG: M14 family murein peptide amidase A [Smithella sp.]
MFRTNRVPPPSICKSCVVKSERKDNNPIYIAAAKKILCHQISAGKIVILLWCFFSVSLFLQALPSRAWANDTSSKEYKDFIAQLEKQSAIYGWTDIKPGNIQWEYYRLTKNNHPLIYIEFGHQTDNCILFFGGVHGDELPAVYLMLKLAHYVKENPALFQDKHIIIAPLLNPDGFLSVPPTRTNTNGVDINRNFPTRDWMASAMRQWVTKTKKNKRYYPGIKPASEQETQFQIALIKKFKPQKILSVHSPLNFFDYDSPSSDLNSFEEWMEHICKEIPHPLKKFGYYPGSLGNYAGHERNIFTLTLELPSSNPKRGHEYFQKFQTSLLKFINLPIVGSPPSVRIINDYKSAIGG